MKKERTFKSAANETKDIFRKSVGTMNGLIGMYAASDGDMFIPSEETLRSISSDYMKIMKSLPDLMDTTIDAYVEQYEDVVWLKDNFEEFRRVQSNRYEDLCKRCDGIERKIDKIIEIGDQLDRLERKINLIHDLNRKPKWQKNDEVKEEVEVVKDND